MYYIYHIPGKKIGVTRDLNKRVTLVQGYKKNEYEVLDSSQDIDYISDREIELQKWYGYKVDRRKYNELYKSNNMKINATEQTSTFPYPINDLPEALNKHLGYQWETQFGTFKLTENSIKWILSNVQVSMYNPNRSYVYNKAFYENCFKETVKKHNKNSLKLFQQIRDWAEKRKLYEIGDANTQYIKLQEECGELAKALLKNNQEEIIDAIGDIVVVLTNLAHQKNVSIEQCISSAYDEIKDRTGKMINGTFVKDE